MMATSIPERESCQIFWLSQENKKPKTKAITNQAQDFILYDDTLQNVDWLDKFQVDEKMFSLESLPPCLLFHEDDTNSGLCQEVADEIAAMNRADLVRGVCDWISIMKSP
jgi:hypothetical protein